MMGILQRLFGRGGANTYAGAAYEGLPRPFRTPLVPLVPVLGVLCNFGLMLGLGSDNWLRLIVWMAIGLAFYFLYGRRHSHLNGTTQAPAE